MSLGGTFNYTMNNPSSVTSTGSGADAIDLTGGAGTVHGAWTIGGTIESTAGTGINIILPLGTGNSGIGMTIGAGGIVKGDNGTAISFGGVSGVNNDTVTNDGQVYAVGSGHNGIFMTAGTGSGLLTVTNEAGGIIGSSALPIGGSAVSMSGLTANGIVTNDAGAQMVSTGTTITMLQGGTGTVTNNGILTSNTGKAISMTVGGNALVTNSGGNAIINGTEKFYQPPRKRHGRQSRRRELELLGNQPADVGHNQPRRQ